VGEGHRCEVDPNFNGVDEESINLNCHGTPQATWWRSPLVNSMMNFHPSSALIWSDSIRCVPTLSTPFLVHQLVKSHNWGWEEEVDDNKARLFIFSGLVRWPTFAPSLMRWQCGRGELFPRASYHVVYHLGGRAENQPHNSSADPSNKARLHWQHGADGRALHVCGLCPTL
jgi:hypothetical protein